MCVCMCVCVCTCQYVCISVSVGISQTNTHRRESERERIKMSNLICSRLLFEDSAWHQYNLFHTLVVLINNKPAVQCFCLNKRLEVNKMHKKRMIPCSVADEQGTTMARGSAPCVAT